MGSPLAVTPPSTSNDHVSSCILRDTRSRAFLTVAVVRREETSLWLVRGTPERIQQVVTSAVVPAVVSARLARYVLQIRTLGCFRLRSEGRIRFQHTGQLLHQLLYFGVRQREPKSTYAIPVFH